MKKTRLAGVVLLALLIALAASAQTDGQEILVQGIPGIDESFIRGADISMLAQIEEVGGVYSDRNGQPGDLLAILKDAGVNWIRLRIWHNPINDLPVLAGDKVISNKGQRVGGGNNGLERTIALAKRSKDMGFKLLLDFHYSDFWTDPGKQKKPAAWKSLALPELGTAVYDYTKDVLRQLDGAGARPDMVQIGNELNNGMLWPDGQIWANDAKDKVGGFDGFIALLKQASKGVRDSAGGKGIRIAVHLAEGGKNDVFRTIFDPITKAGLDFDTIGLSYYPYWHGPLSGLSKNLADLAVRYGKSLVIMETAYAFTTEDGDDYGNAFQVYNEDTLGYRPTVQGQATLVRDVMAAVAAAPGKKGIGAFYWEPAWIPVPGAGWRTGEGNAWENQAMFDFKGRALASLDVFGKVLAGKTWTIQPIATEPVKVTVTIGDKVKLPSQVKTTYSDDVWRLSDVVWEPAKLDDQDKEGVVKVRGKLKDNGLPAIAEINFTYKKNLISDPSFETGKLNDWQLTDPSKATMVENNQGNAKTGNFTYKYWLDKPFKAILTRTFTNLPNGTYAFSCSAMGGGGETAMRIFAKDNGNEKTLSVPVVNTGWKKWVTYTVEGIKVTNNQCTIGIYIDAKAGNWGNFDDVEFFRNVTAKE